MTHPQNGDPKRVRFAWLPVTLLVVPLVAGLGFWASASPASSPNAGVAGPSKQQLSSAHLPKALETSAPALSQPEDRLGALETLLKQDPTEVLRRVRAEREATPSRISGDEVDWIEMRALVQLNRIARARDAASSFYTNHPQSHLIESVHALTGQHLPPRMGPSDDRARSSRSAPATFGNRESH